MPVQLYDTTLRDGVQREGLSLSLEDKLKIARRLDRLGIAYVEGGWPGSNPKDMAFFERVPDIGLEQATVSAFGSTRRVGVAVEDDGNIRALIAANTPAVAIVGKSWDLHVHHVLRTTREENLRMIADSVRYLKAKGREVIYDAEHFFDGYQADPAYALETLAAAAEAGADVLVLCDTNGGALPSLVATVVTEVRQATSTPLGIHAHNDGEMAVANSLIAVERGVEHVQGTVNGYGERCGNANLCSIIPALKLKMGHECVTDQQLRMVTETSHYVSELANLKPNAHLAYVGHSAFAHKGGMHASGVSKISEAFEHIGPGLVGNTRKILISELSGKKSIVLKARELGIDLENDAETVGKILGRIQDLEHKGYQFEAADGSFELLIGEAGGKKKEFFTLESFRVLNEKTKDGTMLSEATVKVCINGNRIIETAEGNGPVNALDSALRNAIKSCYPGLSSIELTDFKVRVLNAKKGTGAMVRVLIESSDGEKKLAFDFLSSIKKQIEFFIEFSKGKSHLGAFRENLIQNEETLEKLEEM